MEQKDENPVKKNMCKNMNKGAGGGAVYGLGLIGALFYFIQHAHTLQDGLIGVLKAIVWPALLIYQALGFFKM